MRQTFDNLEKLAVAMGYPSITLEFLTAAKGHVGSFSRLAVEKGLPLEVGIAAKREFITLLTQGAVMFAPAATPVNAARIAQNVRERAARRKAG